FWNARYGVFMAPIALLLVARGTRGQAADEEPIGMMSVVAIASSAWVMVLLAAFNPPPAWKETSQVVDEWAGRETPVIVCLPDRAPILAHYLGRRPNLHGIGPWDVPHGLERAIGGATRIILVLFRPDVMDPQGK